MASCHYAALVGGPCGSSTYNPSITECVTIKDCTKDISNHCSLYKISEDITLAGSESKLLLARAGIFEIDEVQHLNLTVCPLHRDKHGVRWRSNKTKCSIPSSLAAHKSSSVKAQCGLTTLLSHFLLNETKILIPVGTAICKSCKSYLAGAATEWKSNLPSSPRDVQSNRQQLESGTSMPHNIVEQAGEEGSTNQQTCTAVTLALPQINVQKTDEESTTETSDELVEDMRKLKLSESTWSVFSPDTASTASSCDISEESSTSVARKKKLNEYLEVCNIKPLAKTLLDWKEISPRTQQRYVQKTSEIVVSVINDISSTNAPQLWKGLQNSSSINKAFGWTHQTAEQAYLEALAEAYKSAESWDTRRQVLSTMSDVASFNVISEYIPGLTQYRFTMANLHRIQYGRGAPVPEKTAPRLRISQHQLDHFLSFITSPHLVQDLPFGEKQLRLSSGKTIKVPNIIRTMIPQRIVTQYTQYCEENAFKPFSNSTMLRVLDECSATVRKSLQGLDNFAAQGARAFDDLVTVVQNIVPLKKDGEKWATEVQESLKVGKLYLKGDYKVHVSDNSQVPDHCYMYALSDSEDKDFKHQCNHNHSERCEQCQNLDLTLKSIQKAIEDCTFNSDEERDETSYLFTSSSRAIKLWKGHQLRSVRQDQARLDVIDLLQDEESVYVVNDWAMKFLPRQYREAQSGWFGKKGISWHISVVFRRFKGQLQSQGFIHIVESCSQDSTAIVLFMQHVLRTLETENPELKRAFFRQDNAGCYHSASTILACRHIEKTTRLKITRIDFSDPQGGKGSADRLAATCKCHIRMFVNEGNNVTNAEEMKNALLSHGGVEGVRAAVVPSIDDSSIAQLEKIPGISKLNNFEFKGRNLVAWRAYDVGQGKKIKTGKVQDLGIKWLNVPFSPGKFKIVRSTARNQQRTQEDVSTDKVESDEQVAEEPSGPSIFSCPQEGCVRIFQRSSALEKHLSLESCSNNLERQTMLDIAKEKYASLLKEDVGVIPSISTQYDIVDDSCAGAVAEEGWALKGPSKKYRFNEKQKSYLTAKFNIGQESGRKLKPEDVSRDMRHARGEDGKRLFGVTEFLSVEQIFSFFSRLATKIKQQTIKVSDADAVAAVDEDNFHQIRQDVLSSLQLQHPIVYDQFNVCEMVKKGALQKLKKDMLKRLSDGLGLHTPAKAVKKTYVTLLEDVVADCSCKGQ